MTLTGPRPVPMLTLALPGWEGFAFTPNVLLSEAKALRTALSAAPVLSDPTDDPLSERREVPRFRTGTPLDQQLAENRAGRKP
jgi:hypothetical protein